LDRVGELDKRLVGLDRRSRRRQLKLKPRIDVGGSNSFRKDWSMIQATANGFRQNIARALGGAAAVLFFAAVIIHAKVADAAHDGRGFHGSGGGFHGGGSHPGSRHLRGGFGGIYVPYWWGYGYPYYNYGYYGDYADHRYYGYDPGSSYYGNYPDYGYGSRPNARHLVLLLRPSRLLSLCDTVQDRVAVGSGELNVCG
jgi:hypothetical protein